MFFLNDLVSQVMEKITPLGGVVEGNALWCLYVQMLLPIFLSQRIFKSEDFQYLSFVHA